MAARAKNRSPRHLVLDSQVMRNLQIAPALAPKTHALTCQETLDTLSHTSSMQPVPYLKPDNQKTNLIIRSLADNLMHWVPFLPLAARLSASPQKSPKCSSVGTLRGFRLQREGRKKGEGREERCCGISGDNQALYLLLPHVSPPQCKELQPRPLRGGQGPPYSFRCLPSLQSEWRGKVLLWELTGRQTATAGSRGLAFSSWDEEFSTGCMGATNWARLVWPGTSHLPTLSSWQQGRNWLYLGPPSQRGCGFCEMNLCQISAESSWLHHAFALCLFSCDATHPVPPWQNR